MSANPFSSTFDVYLVTNHFWPITTAIEQAIIISHLDYCFPLTWSPWFCPCHCLHHSPTVVSSQQSSQVSLVNLNEIISLTDQTLPRALSLSNRSPFNGLQGLISSEHILVPLLKYLSPNLTSHYSAPGHFIPAAMSCLLSLKYSKLALTSGLLNFTCLRA